MKNSKYIKYTFIDKLKMGQAFQFQCSSSLDECLKNIRKLDESLDPKQDRLYRISVDCSVTPYKFKFSQHNPNNKNYEEGYIYGFIDEEANMEISKVYGLSFPTLSLPLFVTLPFLFFIDRMFYFFTDSWGKISPVGILTIVIISTPFLLFVLATWIGAFAARSNLIKILKNTIKLAS